MQLGKGIQKKDYRKNDQNYTKYNLGISLV